LRTRIAILVAVLMLLCVSIPAQADNLLTDNSSFTVAYAHSFKNDTDGLIGKLSVDLLEKQLSPKLKASVSFDVNAITVNETMKFGIGGSVKLGDGAIGLGVGVAYLPEPYGWSWNVTAVSFKL
jgi:hypothetical protein